MLLDEGRLREVGVYSGMVALVCRSARIVAVLRAGGMPLVLLTNAVLSAAGRGSRPARWDRPLHQRAELLSHLPPPLHCIGAAMFSIPDENDPRMGFILLLGNSFCWPGWMAAREAGVVGVQK